VQRGDEVGAEEDAPGAFAVAQEGGGGAEGGFVASGDYTGVADPNSPKS